MPIYQLTPSEADMEPVVIGETPVTIGRAKDNIIALDDALLSRYHCVIELATPSVDVNGSIDFGDESEDAPGTPRVHVRDLGSRNGTRVNGNKVNDSALKAGDVITLGSYSFTIEIEETLKERQVQAREAAPLTQLPWITDLTTMINMLPPLNTGAEDRPEMVDGRGKSSAALVGEGEGARATRLILIAASKSRATDVHCEPKGETVQVRFRIDGQMVSVVELPNAVGEMMGGLIKTACQFRQTARESVLDGHFSVRFPGSESGPSRRVDYRVSFTPSVHGQKLVLRVLDLRDAPKSLHDLGLAPYAYERIKKVCEQDTGLLLVCGPTGSGKTTTLYCALRGIDRDRRNVITIEDPVEYQLEQVTQIPVDEARGNTFGSMLRSVLRQDPDVILLGEVRDEETARTAMQAAMTGHLVFSTVHAKDTMSSVFRLLDLKVEPYLVANALELVLAQRLVRVLCENCKRAVRVTPAQVTRMGKYLENQTEIYVATGCAACLRTGYRGRKSIYELLNFNDELRDVVLKEPTIAAMKRVIETGMFTTLVQSGWQQIARGVTTMEEVDRVASPR